MKPNIKPDMYQIIDLIPASIYWKDKEGRYLGCNKYVTEMAGVSSREGIIGKTDAELPWKETAEDLKKIDRYVIEHGHFEVEESPIVNNQKRTYITVKDPLFDAENIPQGIIGVSIDITDQKRAIELENHEKILNETIRLLQLLSGAIAHELRTPLATISAIGMVLQKILPSLIKGYNTSVENKLIKADIKAIQLSLADDAAKSLQKEANEANAFIDDVLGNVKLLALSKDSLDTLSMKVVVNSAIERFNFEDDAERNLVHVNIEQDFEFKGTAIFMQHVFFNLIKNALHYIREAKKGEIYISTELTSQWNILYFKDTGPGMDEEIAKSIFDKGFVSKRTGGTGVGLGFCKQIILQCEGEISCESKKGEYTEFVIKLPHLTK